MYNELNKQSNTSKAKTATLGVLVLSSKEKRSNTGKARRRFQPIESILSHIDSRSSLAFAA